MAFINGFPTQNDIKLPLYTVEPEQLSDLVAVPIVKQKCWNIQLITNGLIPEHKSDSHIQEVSFPFSTRPALFQRYNPDGLKFADEYSLKMYQWYRKYSHLVLLDKLELTKLESYLNRDFPIYLDYEIGQKITVKLPEHRKKIEVTYYYPELNLNSLDIGTSFSDYVTLQPEDMSQWKTILPPSGNKPLSRDGGYIFRRHNNEFIRSPATRSWLLRSETYFCKGQEIEIDEDCLIGSLVITYYEFSTAEKLEITKQISQHYFYENFDDFLTEVDTAILESNPHVFNLLQATKIDFNYSFEYKVVHRENSIEEIRYNPAFKVNEKIINEDSYLTYKADFNNIYRVQAESQDTPTLILSNYQKVNEKFKFGTIIFANNNAWDNYSFNLKDDGEIFLDIGDKTNPNTQDKEITFNYFGNYDRTNFAQNPVNKYIFGYMDNGDSIKIDAFYGMSKSFVRSVYTDAFELIKEMKNRNISLWNNYFTRLLYDSVTGMPDIILKVGNEVATIAYTVSSDSNSSFPDSQYFKRYRNKKVFYAASDVTLTSCNYADSISDRISPTKQETIVREKEILGEIDFSFYKHGENHPESKRWVRQTNGGYYEPNKYYLGESTNTAIDEEISYVSIPSVEYNIVKENGKNGIKRVNFVSNIYLDKYSLEQTLPLEAEGTFERNITATFTVAANVKKLAEYPFKKIEFDHIVEAHSNYTMANADLEEIKKQVREIHLALDAQKFAYMDDTEDVSRVANLGYYTERIARILGISVNDDGSIRSIRQSARIKSGNTIPAGWNIGQWGRNDGGSRSGQTGGKADEERDGLAIEIKSNKFTNDDFTGESNAIEQGGYALVENLPQLLAIVLDDLDRAFGLQDAGANVLPTPNGNQIASYQGMNAMLLDLLYSLGQLSKQVSSTNVLSIKNQAMIQELMSGFGVPITIQELEINAGEGNIGKLPFPGFAANAPTLQDLHTLTNLNLATLIGAKLDAILEEEEEEEEETQEPPLEGEDNASQLQGGK